MPTTSPSALTSGPPELPGLAAASNWMRFVHARLALLARGRAAGPRPRRPRPKARCRTGSRPPPPRRRAGGVALEASVAGFRSSGRTPRPDDREIVLGPRADDAGSDSVPSEKIDPQLLGRRRDVEVGEDRALVVDHDAGADRRVLLVEVFLDPLGRRRHFDRRFRLPRLGRLGRPVVGHVGIQRVSRLEPVDLDHRRNDPSHKPARPRTAAAAARRGRSSPHRRACAA